MLDEAVSRELHHLRETGRRLAELRPEIFGALRESAGADSATERLLAGFALLTARLQSRVQNAFPEAIELFAETLAPQLVTPLPSMTILECSPRAAVRERLILRAGTPFGAINARGEPSTFTSAWDVGISPVSLTEAAWHEHSTSHEAWRLRFSGPRGALRAFARQPVHVYLHGTFADSADLRARVVAASASMFAEVDGGTRALPRARPAHVDSPILPWPIGTPLAVRLLREWFAMPERGNFIELDLSEAADAWGDRTEAVVELRVLRASTSGRSSASPRLYCVPARNVHRVSAEPIRHQGLDHASPLRAAGARPASVYAVEEVVGVGLTGRVAYTHAAYADTPRAATYRLRRETNPIDGHTDTHLAVRPPSPRAEVMSVGMLVTDRTATQLLDVGDVRHPADGTPPTVAFQNLVRPTAPQPAATGTELTRVLAQTLRVRHRSLSTHEGLREWLRAAAPRVEDPRRRAALRWIDGIRGVESLPMTKRIRGAAARGLRTTIELDDVAFASAGERESFAELLDQVLVAEVPFTVFHQLVTRSHPSGEHVEHAPRFGTGPLL